MIIKPYLKQHKSNLINLLRFNTPKYFAPEEEKDFIHYLENEIEDYFVVEYENEIIGAGGINYKKEHNLGVISWDFIHPDHQGKGIGKTLLNYRLKILTSNDEIKNIIVRTTQFVYPFYEKNGFTLKETKPNFWAEGFDLYYMEFN